MHERVEVERIRLKVLPEARRFLDHVGIDLELVGQVGTNQQKDLFAVDGHVVRR